MQLPHSLLYLVTDGMLIGVVNQFKTIKITKDYRQKPVISSGRAIACSMRTGKFSNLVIPNARNASTEISTSMQLSRENIGLILRSGVRGGLMVHISRHLADSPIRIN
ncbi:hypothetical protein SAMN05216315_10779 [Nitrosospira sp. Nsp18]|nr:hypothetical protein SAMN05216315_10779 [Nitrosospira sp. Nsp18]